MNVKETFLNLTSHTVPHGKEIEYLKDKLPMNILKEDPVGNLYIKLGDSNTMFASHLDTVGGDVEVTHVIKGKEIKTDGKSVLGADDKAGVVVMLYMIEAGVPGLYTFFMGEERGCIGSRALSAWIEKNKENEIYKNINKVVSFDRKDVDSVITYQMSERCCSDAFADSLIAEFKKQKLTFRKDTGGSLTDSVHFTDLYPECTNLSVGYWSQHMNSERQDIEFLEKMCKACVRVAWEDLTIKREAGSTERLSYGRGRTSNYYNDWEDEYSYGGSGIGYGGGWNNTKRGGTTSTGSHYASKSTSEYVTDWKGEKVPTKDTVWCEFDQVHCLKDEAIWVDLLGFYTTPDESTISKKKTDNTIVMSDEYKKSSAEQVKNADDISVGDEIVHPQFGKGKVKTISPDKKKINVEFDKGGSKQLLLTVAKIKKV